MTLRLRADVDGVMTMMKMMPKQLPDHIPFGRRRGDDDDVDGVMMMIMLMG